MLSPPCPGASLGYARLYPGRLLALTANSPFWQGRDSGYSSYRRQVWGRWPSSGPTELSGTPHGAMLQRRVHESTGDLAAVVRNAVSHTLSVE